ncbi:cation diffusion facilitator family transporter [Lachnospiraceae bacterium OttesenSCG-928-E19]|nr:cation diffusion facilitator family transporter [Lachnospiraceae bacterium OttesenSCG-928-E19]
MTDFLLKRFVKDYTQVEKMSVRTAYGVLASMVGIFCNVILFVAKAALGILLHSVSVTADAFNNLSDAGSSIISLVGVKLAEKPADAEHPFGHGRMEYISALVVAFIIVEVGFTFLKDAIGKIQHPEALKFQMLSILILMGTIVVKLWLGFFNRKLGRKINSNVLEATARDSINDVLVTAATILSLVCWKLFGINIDGWIGIVVALAVMWAGFSIAKDTLEPLIGQAVTLEVYQKISDFVESYDGIVGSHDLIVHNYGPTRSMASIHAEVPNDVDIEISHEIIDKIERDASEKLGIYLVIHMDPIETKDEVTLAIRGQIEHAISELNPVMSIHDFRMVEGKERINLIFDMVVPHEFTEEEQQEAREKTERAISKIDARYQCVITTEKSFVANEKEI